mmetsp:Transcript_17239/g.21167  ORF Transcript_17239/g.21167 Transcript_17239/m.21167 type:complete len:117 (-) Transcript_17239:13-363(-)
MDLQAILDASDSASSCSSSCSDSSVTDNLNNGYTNKLLIAAALDRAKGGLGELGGSTSAGIGLGVPTTSSADLNLGRILRETDDPSDVHVAIRFMLVPNPKPIPGNDRGKRNLIIA